MSTEITRESVDAVIDMRSRRRCQLERGGLDPVAVAVNLLAETGSAPGWDNDLDGWAA
ncbi:hypothetical protein GV792_27355 [Nocardia cyriacigeorgica]|uniref:hypothetical protein n=1 Tax=Nocardia cyriacigeorgica TaxID=135487 RepID=UPI0013BE4A01|nr:hypothetical protein [Nocardia cyriacigeorgica]NEW53743.1 hypothetical protein [Nocardia cyriacigeorgica]